MITGLQAALLGLQDAAGPLPTPPTRSTLLGGCSRLQGVIATTVQYGTFYAFGPEINMLDVPSDRLAYYQAQKAAGTTALVIGWAGLTYSEPDFTFPVPGPDMRWVNDIPGFCDRLAEIVRHDLHVLLMLPGDGHTGVDDNPFGYQFVMAHVTPLIEAMKAYPAGDLTKYTIICPGFDGVVWNWTSDEVMAYGNLIRSLVPDGYSALEYPAGVLGPFGEGKPQYDGPMRIFDKFYQEFAYPPFSNPDQMWQIGARMLGPKYVRPPDQPKDDDPGAPFPAGSGGDYLSGGTPRGPYFTEGFEYLTYGYVRGHVPNAVVNSDRAYLQAMGYASVG